jgi:predicted nucleotidyltransferase component of viral defense system
MGIARKREAEWWGRMITRLDIEERVREWRLREDVVEKDYVIGWVLWGIGADETLSTAWAFKGGTSLKKCYLETYRFSEDIDFTVLPGGPIGAEELSPILQRVLERVHQQSGIVFTDRPPLLKPHVSGNYTQGRVYYRGPRNAPGVASLILDLSASEKIARPTVLQEIAHAYPDKLPIPGTVRCYSFEEVFAEKIRAMGERSRPRDLYDIINLFRRDDLRSQPEVIRQVLVEKCNSKGVPVPTFAALESSPYRADLENEWGNMLAHQLPELPPFESFWEELPELFDWLEGRLVREELASAPQVGEETDESWTPPATAWTWGEGVPIESLRFAAANHLCVDLGYGDSVRRIEPYAFRRSKVGKVLLCAVKVQTRESRTYRLDRIQSIQVTNQPFRPAFRVEMTGSGHLPVPRLARTTSAQPFRAVAAFHGPRLVYIIKCTGCGKEFKRSTADYTLRPHKGRGRWQCPSLTGHLVRTSYQ